MVQGLYLRNAQKLEIFIVLLQSAEHASRTIFHAAVAPELEGKSGTYIRNCQVFSCSSNANDPKELEKLFQFTCKTLNIKEFGNEAIKE